MFRGPFFSGHAVFYKEMMLFLCLLACCCCKSSQRRVRQCCLWSKYISFASMRGV